MNTARGSRVRKVSSIAATVTAVASLLVAFLHPGIDTTELDLNDGGVWVTNSDLRLVAHLNYPARLLDTGLRTTSAIFNVFQNGEQVYVADGEAATLTQVDVSQALLTTPTEFIGMATNVGGRTVAITDGVGGKVWVQDAAELSAFAPDQIDPDIENVPGALTTVGLNGSVHVVSANTASLESVTGTGDAKRYHRVDLTSSGVTSESELQIAAIGDEAVILDRSRSLLIFPDGRTHALPGQALALQESGPAADSVLVASDSALLEVPFDDGEPVSHAASTTEGRPSRPVRHSGCAYGAWAGTGAFLRQCSSEAEAVNMTVDSLRSAEQAVFRVNRDVIVLNDMKKGSLWLPDENMLLVDNWDQIESTVESEEKSDEESTDETQQVLLPERDENNTPPDAGDDEFGVRAGKTNILPVLQNDSDADGDFLIARPLGQPGLGAVTVARDGAALQVTVPEEATGSASFEYEVSDGRGGTATATVTLTVHGNEMNSAPKQTLAPVLSLGPGRHATVNGLANWFDPDGDAFYLEAATAPPGLNVRSNVNGSVDVAEIGHGPGKETVTLLVSDGRDTGEGEILVNIKDGGNEPPVANADHLVVREGSSATFSPLSNDTDPNGDTLRLVQIDNSPNGVTATMDGAAGTITVLGNAVGTYYLGYLITDGPATGPGVVRIDVIEAGADAPPSPEPDLGVLPAGGQVLVDLLANDSDPTGGVLTVQKVDVPASSPLVVALINNQMVRVTAPRGADGPQTFSYTVSNGVASASATVTILPRAAQADAVAPELNEDRIIVRTGDVASVAVLDNDRSPAGLKMTVSNDLQHEISPDLATVFISDNVVRVRGGQRAGSGRIVYTVHDAMGNPASSVVNLVVVAMDAETNTAPRPKDLTARTTAGREADIVVPLDNIDPEGDSVSLVGLASAPTLGTVTQKGAVLRYRAADDAKGTDSFTYLVEDRLGKQSTATVRVGVAPSVDANQNPVAVPDQVLVRPATKVSVAVLGNDVDPDGDRLSLVSDSLVSQTQGLQVGERAGRVVVTTPAEEGTHVISYGVSDGRGGQAQGLLTIVVKAEAPELAPIARDDSVDAQALQAAQDAVVVVPVLDNDEDPDGDIADAILSSTDANVQVNADNTMSVTATPEPQLLIYTVTDPTGKSASAVIRVPGTRLTRPVVDASTVPIVVKAGQKQEIPLNSHIRAREGRSVLLTSAQKVTAGPGANGDGLVKDATTLVFTAREDFAGPTSISLEVTDGADLNDPEGQTAVLTLPIEVEPAQNRAPVVTPTGVQVAPGEDAVTVNLTPMVSDADGDDPAAMTYSLVGEAPTSIRANVSGTQLSLSAPADAPAGAAGSLRLRVDDGKGGNTEADIPVTIVPSIRPLIQTSDAQITLDAGTSTSIDLTQYATNPYADQGPFLIVGQLIDGPGGSVGAEGTRLNISAAAGFSGSFTVTYTLADVTRDPSREVRGVVTVTVRDKPGAPTNASATSSSAGTAQVSWTAGPANGAPITGFTVTDHTQGDSTDCGLVTTCLIPNRRNGVEHTFSVTATNEVGTSEASNQATTMIDIEPEAPGAPTVKAGDREVTVTWVPPRNEGSELLDYEVTLSPAGTQTVSAGQTSAVFTGLNNGAEYVATVRARNAKGFSPASQASLATVPYGAPGPVGGLTANFAGLGSSTAQTATVDISWTKPANTNGREIEYYTVSAGGITKRVNAPATSTSLEGVGFAADQVQFSVTATNDAANAERRTSEAASTSAWVVGRPPAPGNVEAAATGNTNEVRISYAPSRPGNGWNATNDLTYQWSIDGAKWNAIGASGTTVTDSAFEHGKAVTLQLKAVSNKAGIQAESTVVSAGQAVTPYGPPTAPSISCEGRTNQVYCRWSGGNGNGRNATYNLSGGANGQVGPDGERTIDAPNETQINLCIDVVQAESGRSARNCAEARGIKPAPVYSLHASGLGATLNYENFPHPGSGFTVRCWNAKRWYQRNWNTNFLGEASGRYTIGGGPGSLSIRCPGGPGGQANGDFAIELRDGALPRGEILWCHNNYCLVDNQ